MNAITVPAIVAVRAAVILAAVLATAPASAQDRYPYGREFSAYGDGPQVDYGAGVYGYEPGYIGYAFRDPDSVQRGFGQDPDRSPVGSDAWWRAMDRTGRGGQID